MPQLCRVVLLALSCLVFAVMFGFPGSLLTAFSGGMLANGINQLLFLKASFCLQREQKEDPSETSRTSANTAAVWSNTEGLPQSDIAFICLRRGR